MSGGKAPTPPDPQQTAGAQTGSNIQTAIANQYMNSGNVSGPGYQTTRSQTGTRTITGPDGKQYNVPVMSQNTALTGDNQRIYGTANGATLNTAMAARNNANIVKGQGALNLNGIPQGGSAGDVSNGQLATSYAGDFGAQRDEVQAALMERMNPQLQQDKGALEARLASQGIGIGSAAYEAAMGDFGRQTNDARLTAILGAGDEQSRLVGMSRDAAVFGNASRTQQQSNDLTAAQYADSVRGRAIGERQRVRDDPLQRLLALSSAGQPQQAPQMGMPQGQVANTDIAGLINDNYGSQLNAYNQQQANRGGILGSIMGAGAEIYAASDERVKEDIKKVGKTNDGQQIYTYRYKTGGPIQMGMMAQEVEKKHPDAVKTIGGIKMVNYGKAAR